MQRKLERLKQERPAALEDVQSTLAMGDLSENFGYQVAKGRLRRLNDGIVELEARIARAVIAEEPTMHILGPNGEQTITIVSSAESSPAKGRISRHSPLGSALLTLSPGQETTITTPRGSAVYRRLA
jgi:transcription elongation factor GreA